MARTISGSETKSFETITVGESATVAGTVDISGGLKIIGARIYKHYITFVEVKTTAAGNSSTKLLGDGTITNNGAAGLANGYVHEFDWNFPQSFATANYCTRFSVITGNPIYPVCTKGKEYSTNKVRVSIQRGDNSSSDPNETWYITCEAFSLV